MQGVRLATQAPSLPLSSSSERENENTRLLGDRAVPLPAADKDEENDDDEDSDTALAGGAFLPLTAGVARAGAGARTAREDPRRWTALGAYSVAAAGAAAVFGVTVASAAEGSSGGAVRAAAQRFFGTDPRTGAALAFVAVLPAAACAAWLLVRTRGARTTAIHGAAWALAAALLRAVPALLPPATTARAIVGPACLVLGSVAAGVALALLAALPAPLAALWCRAHRRPCATALLCAPLVLGYGIVTAFILPVAVFGRIPFASIDDYFASSSENSSSENSNSSSGSDWVEEAAQRYGFLQLALVSATALGLTAALVLLPAAPRHAPSVTSTRYHSRPRHPFRARTAHAPRHQNNRKQQQPQQQTAAASIPMARTPTPPGNSGSINSAVTGAAACSGIITAAGRRAPVHAQPGLCAPRGTLARFARALCAPLRRPRTAPVLVAAGLLVGAALTGLICSTSTTAPCRAAGALVGALAAVAAPARRLRGAALSAALALAGAEAVLATAVALCTTTASRHVWGAVAGTVGGAAGGALLPLALELAAETAYPSPEGVASALVLVLADVVVLALGGCGAAIAAHAALRTAAAIAAGTTALVAALGAVLLACVRPRLGRLELDEASAPVDVP